jgi:hypothetical protein
VNVYVVLMTEALEMFAKVVLQSILYSARNDRFLHDSIASNSRKLRGKSVQGFELFVNRN